MLWRSSRQAFRHSDFAVQKNECDVLRSSTEFAISNALLPKSDWNQNTLLSWSSFSNTGKSTASGIFKLQFRNNVLRPLNHKNVWVNLILPRRKLHNRQCSDRFRMGDGFTLLFPFWLINSGNGLSVLRPRRNTAVAFGRPAHKLLKESLSAHLGWLGLQNVSWHNSQIPCIKMRCLGKIRHRDFRCATPGPESEVVHAKDLLHSWSSSPRVRFHLQ